MFASVFVHVNVVVIMIANYLDHEFDATKTTTADFTNTPRIDAVLIGGLYRSMHLNRVKNTKKANISSNWPI